MIFPFILLSSDTLTDTPVKKPNYDENDASLSIADKMSLAVNLKAVDTKATLEFISKLALIYAEHGNVYLESFYITSRVV